MPCRTLSGHGNKYFFPVVTLCPLLFALCSSPVNLHFAFFIFEILFLKIYASSTNFSRRPEDGNAETLRILQDEQLAGYDPYDALNSRIFRALPFVDFRLFRLGCIQVLKRLPINLRPFLLIPKTQNPKALGLSSR